MNRTSYRLEDRRTDNQQKWAWREQRRERRPMGKLRHAADYCTGNEMKFEVRATRIFKDLWAWLDHDYVGKNCEAEGSLVIIIFDLQNVPIHVIGPMGTSNIHKQVQSEVYVSRVHCRTQHSTQHEPLTHHTTPKTWGPSISQMRLNLPLPSDLVDMSADLRSVESQI